jgi:hypothetical protein
VVCDLISDPKVAVDLMQSHLTYGWVGGAAMAPLVALARSAAQYRHIGVGEEDFNGYGRRSKVRALTLGAVVMREPGQ